MGRKRQSLTPGTYDNLTVACRHNRMRWEQVAREEIAAWLMLHGMRASRAQTAALALAAADPKSGGDRAAEHWAGVMNTIGSLLSKLGERWDRSAWNAAVNAVGSLDSVNGEVTDAPVTG